MKKIAIINGREVNLDRLNNPKLRRIFASRGFMFSYGDHSEERGSHRDSGGHVDHYRDSHNYSESKSHTDHTDPDSWYNRLGQMRHHDHTHTPHSDYTEYDDEHRDYS